MHPLVQSHRSDILALAESHGLCDVRLFGSMARDDSNETSDVDLLVALAPGATGLALGGMLMDVQELLHCKVDIVTEAGLHPAFRQRVLREAKRL